MADEEAFSKLMMQGPGMAPNPLADYMQQRRNDKNLSALVRGGLGTAMLAPALMDTDPISLWLARLGAGANYLGMASDFASAGDFRQGQQMWSNTGMPGRPVPDAQNPYLMLQRLRQMQGGGR